MRLSVAFSPPIDAHRRAVRFPNSEGRGPFMKADKDQLERLAARVKQGDPTAVQQFRRQFESDMREMVDHVLRTRTTATPLAQWILVAAARLVPDSRDLSADGRERRIREIAGQFCESVLGCLQLGSTCGQLLATVSG